MEVKEFSGSSSLKVVCDYFHSSTEEWLVALTEEDFTQAIIPTEISSIVKPLVLELALQLQAINDDTKEVKYEKLEPLLIELMKKCHRDKGFLLGVAEYLVSNEAVIHCFAILSESMLEGQTIQHTAASCLTLVCECFRMLTAESDLLTLKAAEAKLIVIVLRAMLSIANVTQYQKVSSLLLQSLFGLIQVFAENPTCRIYFKSTRFVSILTLFTAMHQKNVKFMSVYTLLLLGDMIPVTQRNVLVFEEKDIKEYIDILSKAVSSPGLNAVKVFGSLVIPADDILRMMKQLWIIKPNRHSITANLGSLISSMEICLLKGCEIQQKAAMDLMWTLICDPEIQAQITSGDACIDSHPLEKLATGNAASDNVSAMALCVLCKLKPEQFNEHTMLEVIKGAYTFKWYAQCIDWCNQIVPLKGISEITSLQQRTALLYRGQSFSHLYRQEQNEFEDISCTLSTKELHLRQDLMFEKAGQAIKDLGVLFDLSDEKFLDDEISRCLDVCMISIACKVNNLKSYSRCLLCLKKAKLHRSHLCPNAILDAFASGLPKTKNKQIYNLSFFREGSLTSPKGVNMWLFCTECEGVLCRDGEKHFIPKFFRSVYRTGSSQLPEHELHISYDEWLYRFAIGLLFRGLINEAFSSFSNSDKVHSMFAKLRKLVCFEGSLSSLPDNPTVYLLASPSDPSNSSAFTGHIYHAPFVFALTHKGLNNGHRSISRTCRFFLARIGILNFVLVIDESIKKYLPDEAQIKVCRGSFLIPSEDERASSIPYGISCILADLAAETQKNVLESSLSTLQGLKLNNPTPPPDQLSATYKMYSAINSDMKTLKGEWLTNPPLNSPQLLDLLPPEFALSHSNGTIFLPISHQVIFHGDFVIEMEGSKPFNITLFLAAGNEESSEVYTLQKPYVIFHRYQPGLTVSLGYFIDPCTCKPLRFLPDPHPKVMIHDIGQQLNISYFTKTLLPELMDRRGLKSYHTVVHRALIKRDAIYDHVCGKRCWYCMLRCNTCMSQAAVDMSSAILGGSTQRFCSEACKNVYFSDSTRELTFFDPAGSLSEHILLLSFDTTLPCSTGGYVRADISLYLCNDPKSQSFPNRSLYVVYRQAAILQQYFLEYFVHSDCSFDCMLQYYKSREYPEMDYAINFATLVLSEKLQELGIEDMEMFIDFVVSSSDPNN